MPAGPQKPIAPWLLAGGLLILLLILATLQFRWLDEVSQANRQKSRDLLQAAVDRFAEDFDRELTRAFFYLLPPQTIWTPPWHSASRLDESFASRYERWRTYAPFPDLVRDVYMAQRKGDGTFEATRFAVATGTFEPVLWPDELEPLESRLAKEWRWPRRRGPRDGMGRIRILSDEIPALILPISGGRPPEGRFFGPGTFDSGPADERRAAARSTPATGAENTDASRLGGRMGGGRRGELPFSGLMILMLDLETIRDAILPELTQRHLSSDSSGTEYEVTIFALRDRRVIFRHAAPLQHSGDDLPEGDAKAALFSLLPSEKLGALELEAGLRAPPEADDPDHDPDSAGPHGRSRHRRGWDGHLHRIYRVISSEENAVWQLVASHPEGSLDAAIDKAHRRNLMISFGILLLLAASLILILASTRRIQALARQQLEFVAGVTHELLTPLAAMRSAGQNLADGVVAEPRQVQRYGRLVEDEGRRLSTMVEQVLEFAGMQAGRRSYALSRARLAPIVDSALAEYRGVLDEQGVEVDKSLGDSNLEVMADAPALRRAIQNLIANALKYGAQGGWIGVRVGTTDDTDGAELRISVEDKGPGIATADLPRLFEPFYRGQNGSASDNQSRAIPGSGLGLSLVKHIVEGHGGRITVASEEGLGSTFTLYLPAASPANSEEHDEL